MDRNKVIVRTSIIGIAANAILSGFKAFVGLLTGSIAIILDSVNNLSDVLSSVVTIIGTVLARKKPDKEHPFGHGRAEYMTAMVIAAIILYAGITALIESVKKIIHPVTPDYPPATLIILVAAVGIKLLLGTYVRNTGRRVNSESLIASGKDALLDSVISASTIAAALIFLIFGVSLEAWLGGIIALVIIRSGFGILLESISDILGERIDDGYANDIKETIAQFPQVSGVYDLLLHNYGPDKLIGSVHIEVPDYMTAAELDSLERDILEKVFSEHGVILAGISIYSKNTNDDTAADILEDVRRTVMSHSGILQLHGFNVNHEKKKISFDIIIDYAYPDHNILYETVCSQVKIKYPDYAVSVTLDLS